MMNGKLDAGSPSAMPAVARASRALGGKRRTRRRADLSRTDLRRAGSLAHRALTALIAPGANFYGLDLSGASLQGSNLEGADLRSAKLGGADLRGSNIADADLSGAKQSQALGAALAN